MTHPDSNSADTTAGAVAYRAYFAAVGGEVSYGPAKGKPLPTWEEQRDDPDKTRVVDAWEAAGNAVIAAYRVHMGEKHFSTGEGADILRPGPDAVPL